MSPSALKIHLCSVLKDKIKVPTSEAIARIASSMVGVGFKRPPLPLPLLLIYCHIISPHNISIDRRQNVPFSDPDLKLENINFLAVAL